jgi:hypothetical protein
MTKSTYRRRNVTAQPTWKKSHAGMVKARERRNRRHADRNRRHADRNRRYVDRNR